MNSNISWTLVKLTRANLSALAMSIAHIIKRYTDVLFTYLITYLLTYLLT